MVLSPLWLMFRPSTMRMLLSTTHGTLESWAGRLDRLDASLASSEVVVVEASQGMSLERVPGLEGMEVKEGMDEASRYAPTPGLIPFLWLRRFG